METIGIHQDYPEYRVTASGKVIGVRGRELAPWTGRGGWRRVMMRDRHGRDRLVYVDELVARVFLGEGAGMVRHLNGDNGDDRVENLERCGGGQVTVTRPLDLVGVKWSDELRLRMDEDQFRRAMELRPGLASEEWARCKMESEVLEDCRSGMKQRSVAEKWGMSQADVSRLAVRAGLRRRARPLDEGQVRRAMELRAGGMGWKEIAKELGCSKQVAWKAGRRARPLDGV